ncbi:MAG: hypothetical protein WBZ29_13480 [Methanocella sp.]
MKKRVVFCVVPAVAVLFLIFSPVMARASIDTGFSPARDGFAFANFGDPESIAGVDLNLLTGARFHDEVFSHTGHCFGMAMASVERYESGETSINLQAADAMTEIDRIQTEQSFYYIADFFCPPFGGKTYNCTAEYARLYARLSGGKPAVIGVYSTTGSYPGHAVVAYKIKQEGEMSYIYVYDPNFPATERDYMEEPMVAVYDSVNGTFLYDNGRTFDELQLDDIDIPGIIMGKVLSMGFLGLPLTAVLLIARRPGSRQR